MKFPLLVLLAAGALSAPRFEFNDLQEYVGATESKCNNPRRLTDAATSVFEYEGETLSTIQGSTSESTGMRMRAKVFIHPQRACRFSMQINNAELLVKSKNGQTFVKAGESAKFARELEAQHIFFETSGGRIKTLFPSAAEATHILNIKRGILSTLQLGETKDQDEVDVNGRCKVSVVEKNGMFVKSKNLSECSERTHNELGIQTATLENNEMPINPLNSTSTCYVSTKDDKIVETRCVESHIFRPFSAGYQKSAGAMTTVTQTMKFVAQKIGRVLLDIPTDMETPYSMVYQHDSEIVKPDSSIVGRIESIMSKLVDISRKNMAVKQSSAHEFTQLVTLLRKLDRKRMRPIMEKYLSCEKSGLCKNDEDLKTIYRQYFLDALTYCGTPTCVSTVHGIIMRDGVSGENTNMFLQGIALVAKPTSGMIRDVKDIAARKPSRQAFLTLGILMHRFCSGNAAQCAYGKTNPITHAELFLEDKLGRSCEGQEDLEKVEEILMAIKAIGNAGRPSRAAITLLSCAKTAKHQNITAAALEALRRMPCNEEIQSSLHDMLENINMDTEKRIQSYIALMRCPGFSTIKRIVGHLEKEQSRQVGSFMWSHLKNINESSDPRHKSTQEFLATVLKGKSLKEFNFPATQFSKAFEGSLYSKYLRSGASVDGHMIFNPDSYIPRSALLNVTANILDVPVNVFEMAARVEGVETLIEEMFGQDGYFPDNSIVKIFDYTFTKADKAKLRTKRNYNGVAENIESLHEKVNKKRVQPSGSLSMKVLGHEMRVFSYDDIPWAVDQIDNMNVIDLLLKVARGGRKTFTKSVLFLELTHSVPTGLGLPIKLGLKGSAVGSLELDGKFDIRNMFWGPSAMEIKGYVRPSAVVEVSGRMGVHSHYIDTGIFVNTSMYTSQMIQGSISYKQGKMFKVNIDAPEKPIEFFNVSSTPFLFVNEEVTLIQGSPRRLSPNFCLNSTMVLGFGVCTSMSVPVAFRDYEAAYFPLSGPAHFGMKIVKADAKLTTYQFLVALKEQDIKDGFQYTGSYEFGTPGATYSRGLSGIVKYQETNKMRRLILGEFKDKKSAEFMVEYHNDTKRFEVIARSNLLTAKTMQMGFLFFNDVHTVSRKTGIMMSAEYDWYKFQQITYFTKNEESYSLRSKTTYWPEKFVQASAKYTPTTRDLMFRIEANQINQTVQMNGRYLKTETEKGLNFTVQHIESGRKSSVYMGWMNSASTKKVVFNTTCSSNIINQISLGYYRGEKSNAVRFDAEIAGKTGAFVIDYSNTRDGWFGMDIGAVIQGQYAGVVLSSTNENGRDACVTAYYNAKRPAKTCISLKKVDDITRLMWSVEVLKRTGAVSVDYSSSNGGKGLKTTVTYNNKELFTNALKFVYKSMLEMEVQTTTVIGTRQMTARVFSEVQKNSDIAVGIEANGFKTMLKLQATYSRVKDTDKTLYAVKVEGWVNQKLPVNYVVSLTYGMPEIAFKSVLSVKDYQMISSVSWSKNGASKRSATRFFGILKRDFVIFSNQVTDTFALGSDEKFFKTEWQFTVWNKNFKYGWDVTYKNRSTESKSAHAITFGVNYARNRRSSVTTTFANSKRTAEILVDVMYIPNRQVSHVLSYNKESRQVDISVEFLPKMFIKLMGRLDKVNGWKITTDLKFTWSNYNRVLTSIASYVNRTDIKGMSFRFLGYNREIFVGSEFNNKTKTAIFTVSAFGRSLRLAGYWVKSRQLIGMRLMTETKNGNELIPRELIEALVSYSETKLTFELKTHKTRYFKTIAVFDKKAGVSSLEVIALHRSIFKVQGEVRRPEALVVSRLFVLGNERFQVVAKYDKAQKRAFITFDALKKYWNVMFAAQYNSERKEVRLSTQVLGRTVGFTGRFDASSYAASSYMFYQKHQVGWAAYYDASTNAVVYNVTVTPTLSAQVVMQILADRIVAVTLQRKFGSKIVDEGVFRYELNSATSNVVFKWNKDTTTAIRNMIVPIANRVLKNATSFLSTIGNTGKRVGVEVARNITSQLLRLINEADSRFDNIDFSGLKTQTGEIVVKILKQAASLTNKGLKMTSKALSTVHKNLPEIMEKTRQYSRKSVAITQMAMSEATKIAKIVYKVAKNLTESGIPVAKTALRLAKEFKIRGKTMEQIVSQAAVMAEKITKTWRKNLSIKIAQNKKIVVEYINNMPVPYRKEKLGQLIKMYLKRIQEIQANFNLEEKTRQLTRDFMNYKIKETTIAKHIENLSGKIENLPEELKHQLVRWIGETRSYVKKMKKIFSAVDAFAQPLVRCLTKMRNSINKHFSPLYVKAATEAKNLITSEFAKVYSPTKEVMARFVNALERFFAPILKPFQPLYFKIKNQLRSIRVVEMEIGSILDIYLEQYKVTFEKKLEKMNAKFVSAVNKIVASFKKMSSMPLENMAEYAVDSSIEIGKDTIMYAKTMYKNREATLRQWKSAAEKTYSDAKKVYTIITSKPIEDMIHIGFEMVGKQLMSNVKQFAAIIDQIAAMDIEKPLEQAWKDMDLANHLEKYGVCSSLIKAITAAKKFNLTETLFASIDAARQGIMKAYGLAEMKYEKAYRSVEGVYKYIRSIPRKEWEDFYAEVESYLVKNKGDIYQIVKKIVSFARLRLTKTAEVMKKSAEQYIETYGKPVMNAYRLVKERAALVYAENKNDCVIVMQMYKSIAVGIMEEKYEIVKKSVEKRYNEYYKNLVAFYNKHEGKTWEEIGENAFAIAKKNYDVAYQQGEKNARQMQILAKKGVVLAKEFYANATRVAEKYIAYMKTEYQTTIRPKAIQTYTKAMEMYTEAARKIKETAVKYYERSVVIYNQVLADALKMYESNKKLSIRQLYHKGVNTVSGQVSQQMRIMQTMAKKNYANAYATVSAKAIEMKQKIVKEVSQVLPVVLTEAESIFNQTLRAAVILANETVKAYTPHCIIVKEYAAQAYGNGRVQFDQYYKDVTAYTKKSYVVAKEQSMDMYARALTRATKQVQKIVSYLKEFSKKVQEHPKYLRIVNSEYTVKMIKLFNELLEKMNVKVAELKVKVQELKKHPKVVEYTQKIEEYTQKIKALRQHPNVLKMLQVLRQVKASGSFTALKLKGKMMPHIQKIRVTAAQIPATLQSHAALFRRDPAECVWSIFADLKSVARDVRDYDWKSIDCCKTLRELVNDVTDAPTKQTYANLKKQSMSLYVKYQAILAAAPAMIKEKSIKMYNEKVAAMKNQWENAKGIWKSHPLSPIVHHDIWRELVNEVVNHEIVTEVSSLASQAKDLVRLYKTNLINKIKAYSTEKKAAIVAKYNQIVAKYNAFVDETTLEDIVNKVQETYTVAKASIKARKDKLTVQMKKAYAAAMAKYAVYEAKVKVIGKKYYVKADKIWKEKYPQLVANATRMYKQAMKKLNKIVEDIVRYSKEMKTKAIVKSLKMWNESALKRNLITLKKNLINLKGMTVGETVAEIKMLPLRARKLYAQAEKIVGAKYLENLEILKTKYNIYVRPHAIKVERVVRAVVHEFNATGIFIYRYYNVEGNMEKVRSYGAAQVRRGIDEIDSAVAQFRRILPSFPGIVETYLQKAAQKSLKSVHSSLVYLDNVDLTPYINKIKNLKQYIPDVNKYVVLDTKQGELVFMIPHYKPIQPSFNYQIKSFNQQIKKIETTLREKADKISKETVAVTKKMLEYIRNKTAEIRGDFTTSFVAHSRLARHLQGRAIAVSAKVWNSSADLKAAMYETAVYVKNYSQKAMTNAMTKGQAVSKAVVQFTNNAVVDITYSKGLEEAYSKAEGYSRTAMQNIKQEFTPTYEAAKSYYKVMYQKLAMQYAKMMYKVKPYTILLRTAVKDWRQGTEFRTAFRVIEVQLRKAYRNLKVQVAELKTKMSGLKTTVLESFEPEDFVEINEFLASHKVILGKYANRLHKIYRIGKYRVDKAIRKAKMCLRRQWKAQPFTPYRSVAIIFGKNHVKTFDNKFYDVPKFTKKHCTYLLARDFNSGNFTVLSQAENLIVQTPDIEVTIHQNGAVVSTVKAVRSGYEYKKIVHGLPVESENAFCVRKASRIVCEFEQGLQVSCNVDHFMCTISVSALHYGKTQGLLGTNNHEIFDEFKTPDNTVASSATEFVNSWLVTRDGGCIIKDESNEAPSCNKAPSEKCYEVLKNTESPLAPLFKKLDPLPFLKACLVDSADCESDEASITSHCNATAAYRMTLRQQGYAPPKVDGCRVYTTKEGMTKQQGNEWVERVNKDVDIVVMVSQRKYIRKLRKTLAMMLYSLNKNLVNKGFNTRYALIGFGGDKVHEEPHLHMNHGQEFTDVADLTTMIKRIAYTGEKNNTNDAYGAIHLGSKLALRPGAKRVFMMFNFDDQKSGFFGPSFEETMVALKRKASATLIVFDHFNFNSYGQSRVIGQTVNRVYLSPDFQAVPLADYKMPRSAFTKLVRATDGGMFLNEFRPSQIKVMVTAVSDALVEPLSGVSCQECRLTGRSPICKTNNRMTC